MATQQIRSIGRIAVAPSVIALFLWMIVPLAMRLREQGVPVKICYLGHRDGTAVMVSKKLPGNRLRDFAGKTFAIPSKYSNQNLMIHKLMEKEGIIS